VTAPVQPWPPALIFHCPDCDDDPAKDWSWHASDGRGYRPRLARAWARHRAEAHDEGLRADAPAVQQPRLFEPEAGR